MKWVLLVFGDSLLPLDGLFNHSPTFFISYLKYLRLVLVGIKLVLSANKIGLGFFFNNH
jgi:hypothetical protein